MAIGIGQLDLQKYAALQSSKVSAPSSQPLSFGGGSVSPANIDVNAINELARKNALSKTKNTEAAAAASVNPIQQVQTIPQQPVEKVDFQAVSNKFGAQPVFASADKFKGFAAGGEYAKSASKINSNEYGQYDALKSFKSNEINGAKQASTSNPFAAALASNGSNVTSGLNFAGVNNLNLDKKMFIA